MPQRSLPSPAWTAALLAVVGVVAAPAMPDAAATLPLLCCVVALVLLLLLHHDIRSAGTARAALAAGLCVLGGAAKYLLDSERTPAPPAAGNGETIVVGVIQDEPVNRNSRLVLLLDAAAAGDTAPVPWHTCLEVVFPPARAQMRPPHLAYGMTIAVRGMLECPSPQRNPGEFNPRRYKEANGVTHTLAVPAWDRLQVLSPAHGSWIMREMVIPSRRAIRSLIETSVGGEEGELLKGLIVGERTGLSAGTKEAFINAGVAHVLAVSGSNVAVVAAILFLVFQIIRVPRLPRTVCVMGGLFFYMQLTGSQPPVVRATIMAVAMLTGRLLRRRTNALNSLGGAALLMVALDARQVYDLGFQLSFASVASIVLLYPRLSAPLALFPRGRFGRGAAWLLRVCAVSLAATLGTLPLTAASFGRVSVIGVLANLAVIPATELSVVLGAATIGGGLAGTGVALAYGALNRVVLHWTLLLTHLAGFSPVAYIDTAGFSTWEALLYLLVLGVLLRRHSRPPARIVIAVLLWAVYQVVAPLAAAPGRSEGLLRVSVIDVGQGDAVLAELPDRSSVLIDAGPRTANMDAGQRIVLPYLRRCGIDTLDLLIVSHHHADHAGGVPALVAGLHVRRTVVLAPRAFCAGLAPLMPPHRPFRCDSARPGDMLLRSGCARIYLLAPMPGDRSAPDPSGNFSLMLKLQYGRVSFLLAGDAGSEQEEALIPAFEGFLRSTVLKVAHHGSTRSTGRTFLETVRPQHAAVSVGRHNAFRHPSRTTLARLAECGAVVSRTDREGAIIFETDGAWIRKLEWR